MWQSQSIYPFEDIKHQPEMLESLADNFKGNAFLNLCQAILSLVIMLRKLVSLGQEADRKESNCHVHMGKASLSINKQILV